MLHTVLILLKILIFVLFKDYPIGGYYQFYDILYDQINDNLCTSQKKYFIPQINKKYIYHHKYDHTNRASYQDSVYIVKPGDTLFYIAWITGNNYLDLAKNNNIKNINALEVNQVLNVKLNTIDFFWFKELLKKIFLPVYSSCKKNNELFITTFIKKKKINLQQQYMFSDINKINDVSLIPYERVDAFMNMRWHWPADGVIVKFFSDVEGGNTGIDISGSFNQPILAATKGRVVYVGNILKGYGNLIIIKHNNHYLSAYAHNNKILVAEQQYVKTGEQIATMGNSGTNEVKLHFEIRYKGKSINPLNILPKLCSYQIKH